MGTRRLKALLEFDVTGEGDLKEAANHLKDVANAGEKAGKGAKEAEAGASSMDKLFTKLITGGALLAAGKQLLEFGKASLAAASDVQEMQSKFDTVFKDLGGEVTAELQNFADAANRSVYDLQGFAATLQDTFVPLGFARDEAASTSIEIVKLAEDLASFNNLETGDVVRDLQSALVGNTETLRKYGVVASQAAIDQEALALGLDFTKGSMDAQTKAAAILSLTMKGTTDAQGDAIKTADSYANVSKGLEAAMSELKVTIGQELIPVMTGLATATTAVVKSATSEISAARQLKNAYDEGKITLGKYLLGLDLLVVKGAEGEAVLTSLGISQDQLAEATASANIRTNEQARAMELTAQFAAEEAAQLARLVGHLQSTGEEAGKMSGAQDMLNTEMQAGPAYVSAYAEQMGAYAEKVSGAVSAAEPMPGILDAIHERLGQLGNRHDFVLNLDVQGLAGLEEAIRKASGFNANDAPDPYNLPAPRDPYAIPTDFGDNGGIGDPVKDATNSSGYKQ